MNARTNRYTERRVAMLLKFKENIAQSKQVMVYGTLRKGYPLHHYMKLAVPKGKVWLKDYAMINLGAFPAIFKEPKCMVYGEVYEIDERILETLDSVESEGYLYHRELVNLPLFGLTWVYTQNRPKEGSKVTWIKDGYWRGPSRSFQIYTTYKYGASWVFTASTDKSHREDYMYPGNTAIKGASLTASREEDAKLPVVVVGKEGTSKEKDHHEKKQDDENQPFDVLRYFGWEAEEAPINMREAE